MPRRTLAINVANRAMAGMLYSAPRSAGGSANHTESFRGTNAFVTSKSCLPSPRTPAMYHVSSTRKKISLTTATLLHAPALFVGELAIDDVADHAHAAWKTGIIETYVASGLSRGDSSRRRPIQEVGSDDASLGHRRVIGKDILAIEIEGSHR